MKVCHFLASQDALEVMLVKEDINRISSQSLEDTLVGYILQKYTLDNYTLEKYTLAQKSLVAISLVIVATSLVTVATSLASLGGHQRRLFDKY